VLLLHNFASDPGVPFSTKVSPKAIASRFNQAKLSENPYPRMPVGAPDKAGPTLAGARRSGFPSSSQSWRKQMTVACATAGRWL